MNVYNTLSLEQLVYLNYYYLFALSKSVASDI